MAPYALLLVLSVSLPMLAGLSMLAETEEELLFSSTSPEGTYALEAYRVNTAAIEPFYAKVSVVEGEKSRRIYYVRGQSDVEIVWQSDTVAQINGVPVAEAADLISAWVAERNNDQPNGDNVASRR